MSVKKIVRSLLPYWFVRYVQKMRTPKPVLPKAAKGISTTVLREGHGLSSLLPYGFVRHLTARKEHHLAYYDLTPSSPRHPKDVWLRYKDKEVSFIESFLEDKQ